MQISRLRAGTIVAMVLVLAVLAGGSAAAKVVRQGSSTFLVDRTGERWDITQAVSMGFDPRRFEFGIGRYAFSPLDDSHWSRDRSGVRSGMRVIGVAGNGKAHAYAVGTLSRHETANTFLGDTPIVAGY